MKIKEAGKYSMVLLHYHCMDMKCEAELSGMAPLSYHTLFDTASHGASRMEREVDKLLKNKTEIH
jgi:hypothetical protein